MAQACFLGCFADLEEFYYVVEISKEKELCSERRAWGFPRNTMHKLSDGSKVRRMFG